MARKPWSRRPRSRCAPCPTTTPSSRPRPRRPRRLRSVSPGWRRRSSGVFFTGSGSEANDTVIRLVRRYWDLVGQPRQGDRLAPERLPRLHAGGVPGRHGRHARARRTADPGHRPHRPAALLGASRGRGQGLTRDEFGLVAARLEEKIAEIGADRWPPSSPNRFRARAA